MGKPLTNGLDFVVLAALLLLASNLEAKAAEAFHITAFTLAYTNASKFDSVYGYGTDDEKLTTVRLDHYGAHGLGDNYFIAEVYLGKNVGNIPTLPGAGSLGDNTDSQSFFAFVPRLSLSKVTGSAISLGPIKDVYLAGRLEYASYFNFLSENVGISFDWAVPGTVFFETDFFARNDQFTGDTTDCCNLFFRNIVVAPFQLRGMKFRLTSTLYLNDRKDDVGTQVFLQPDLTVVLGETGLEVGYRHEVHRYRDYSRITPTLLAKWNF